MGTEAGDRNIVRHAQNRLSIHPAWTVVPAIIEHIFDASKNAHLLGVFGTHHLPRAAENNPIIGMLDLVAVVEGLLEEPKLVVDAVAERRVVKRREGIEEARSEATKAAIAKPHVDFGFADFLEVLSEGLEGLLGRIEQPGGDEIIAEETSHEILEGEIVNPADVVGVVHGLRGNHPLMDCIAHRVGGGDPPVARRGGTRMARERRNQMALNQ